MRYLAPILVLISTICYYDLLTARTAQSYHGKRHTLSDTLRVLFLYVGFTDSDSTDNIPGWKHDEIPDWAKGDYNQVLDTDMDSSGQYLNLTHYYHTMSQGKFVLVGDVFPEMIRVPLDTFTSGQNKGKLRHNVITHAAFDTINARISRGIESYVSWDWSQYDRRKNKNSYTVDNSLYSDTQGTPAGPDGLNVCLFLSFGLLPLSRITCPLALVLF